VPTVLESFIDPVRRNDFREQYYGKQPLLIRGHPKKFAGLFHWDDLNRLLNASPHPHPHVRVAAPGTRDEATSSSLIERCRAGASLVFNQIDLYDPKIGELTHALAAETGELINVNLYLSQAGQAAAGRHYDLHDVFVLQIDGHKAWSVYDPTIEKPIQNMTEVSYEAPSRPVLECELAPGDVLYIPRGHWHEALAQRGLSLHLTVGLQARTGIDYLTWFVDQLRSDVRFRQEFPLSFDDDAVEVRKERLQESLGRLKEILMARLDDVETVESFLRHCVISDRDAGRFKFPAQLFEAPGEKLDLQRFSRPARQRYVVEDGPTEDQIALSVWGHIFHFPKAARPLIEFVLTQTAFTREDALSHAGALTEQGVWEVLNPLVREGILDAVPNA